MDVCLIIIPALLLILLDAAAHVNGKGLCWTKWINRQAESEGNDVELLTVSELLANDVCLRPYAVDVRRLDGLPVAERLQCRYNGCECASEEQDRGVECSDYEVRFLCPCVTVEKKQRTDGNFLMCAQDKSVNITCPKGNIKVHSVYRGVLWFSPCGLNKLGSYCHSNKDRESLLPRVASLCDGKPWCQLRNEELAENDVTSCDQQQQLHVQIHCHSKCSHEGKSQLIGSVFPSADCRRKCHCLHGGRVVCHRLCPKLKFTNCSSTGLLRLTKVPSSDFKQCQCYKPSCVKAAKDTGCFFNGAMRASGSLFEVNCKYECECLESGKVECMQLCPENPILGCPDGTRGTELNVKTSYDKCTCPVRVCRSDDNTVTIDRLSAK